MSRVLRLTLLAPDIVEAILDGRQPEGMRLEDLLEVWPTEWDGQRDYLAIGGPSMSRGLRETGKRGTVPEESRNA